MSKAKEWYTKLQEEDAVGEDVVVAIAGNKCDCTAEQRTVPLALGESFAANNNLLHFETSAKTGQGVREMFSQIVQNLPAPGNDVDDGKVDMSSDKKGKKKGCCWTHMFKINTHTYHISHYHIILKNKFIIDHCWSANS